MSSFACCFGVSRLKSGLHASPICSTAWEYRERVVLWPREQAIEGAHCLRLKEPSAPQSLHLAKRRKLIACISARHYVCASVQELVATLKCSRNPVLRCRFAYDFQMLSVFAGRDPPNPVPRTQRSFIRGSQTYRGTFPCKCYGCRRSGFGHTGQWKFGWGEKKEHDKRRCTIFGDGRSLLLTAGTYFAFRSQRGWLSRLFVGRTTDWDGQ